MTHELTMKQHNDTESRKKKAIALKSVASNEEGKESSEDEEDDEDMALIIRKFKKFVGKKR